jgi:serine/threonine-protein kinase
LDGRYRLLRLLGRGGMGEVYLSEHLTVGRQLAVKFLLTEYSKNEEMLERFYREARTTAAIGHTNIINVLDVGVSHHGDPYLVMEYLEGESLATMLKRLGPMDHIAAFGLLEQVLFALNAAHEKGIVHRDIKPDNIFILRQEGGTIVVKLIDFGVSKILGLDDYKRLTRTGSLLGTPAYMSPEQARGAGDVDFRSDLYSVGVILYEMLTGELPHKGANYNELLANMLTSEARAPAEVYSRFPAVCEEIVTRAISKDPATRFQSALEMHAAFAEFEGFEHRRERSALLAAGARITTFAGGDLGEATDSAGSVSAEEVLNRIAHEGTPTGWSAVSVGAFRSPLTYVAVVVLILGGAGILIALLLNSREPEAEPESDRHAAGQSSVLPGERESRGEKVLISVEGAPAGAQLYYNGSLVPMNTFPVPKGEALVPVRLEAEGYRPFSIAVLPSEDRTIRVSLEPMTKDDDKVAADEQDDEKAELAEKKGKKKKLSAEQKGAKGAQGKKYSATGRGTEIAEDFE